jgi:hypothetical protein
MGEITSPIFWAITIGGTIFVIAAAVNEHLTLRRQKRRRIETAWTGPADAAGERPHHDKKPVRLSGNGPMIC